MYLSAIIVTLNKLIILLTSFLYRSFAIWHGFPEDSALAGLASLPPFLGKRRFGPGNASGVQRTLAGLPGLPAGQPGQSRAILPPRFCNYASMLVCQYAGMVVIQVIMLISNNNNHKQQYKIKYRIM